MLAEVIIGLEQLHQEGYLHRDIKSQNVLIKSDNGKEVTFMGFSASNWQISVRARVRVSGSRDILEAALHGVHLHKVVQGSRVPHD